MSRFTDLLEEHTAEAVWEAMMELANKIEELANNAITSDYAKFHRDFRQGVEHMRSQVWDAVGHYSPNPGLDDEG